MAKVNGRDAVTNKTLYEELAKLRDQMLSRREGYLLVGGALVLGQIAARLNVHVPDVSPAAAAIADFLF